MFISFKSKSIDIRYPIIISFIADSHNIQIINLKRCYDTRIK